MYKRSKMQRASSKSLFRNTAKGAHPKNFRAAPMRGGIRL